MTPLLLALLVAAPALGEAEPPALRGKRLYARMCAVCHGLNAEGYHADNAPAIGAAGYLGSVSDEFLRKVIADGRPETTMSAWSATRGGPLSSADVDDVVAYLRSMDPGEHAPLDERPLSGSAEKGKPLFALHCADCHGQTGMGGNAPAVGNPPFLRDASNGLLRRAIAEGRGEHMPGFQEKLGDAGIDDIIAWLRVLESSAPVEASPQAAPAPPLPLGQAVIHPKGPEPEGFKAYPAFTPADVVKRQLDRGAKMAFLDARAASDYLTEHIKGAVSVPFYDPAPYLPALPKDTWLICYCACPHSASGHLAGKLLAAGFRKVTVLDEGYLYWKNKKYGVRKGPDP
ncbi:MAG: c-type cytochrome [Elusimicrobia bacterium]|nr:c-type cytochrome [Elusimicrobiota bacterium]